MKNYNWKLLSTHVREYNGDCVYCGGSCRSPEASDERLRLDLEIYGLGIQYRHLTDDKRRRYRYLYARRENETQNWKWSD
ncbi:hypothetical protein [Microvirus mar27]|uniref:Uncharacterized protein n=1 Tax=Microvirus mar27 TaxID=2851160 RepID=A0A8F6AI42_9VIRU|nr:hypothetical protein [Microvirus mar27]